LEIDGPEGFFPWTIHATQVGGSSGGFIIADRRGVKYLIKFDHQGFPELETGVDVVVDRLLWACGYNVPEDLVVYVRPEQFAIAPGTYVGDALGHRERPLDRAWLDHYLKHFEHERDGRLRAVVSRWLPGKPLGGPPFEGVRDDDPNDRIPHEL